MSAGWKAWSSFVAVAGFLGLLGFGLTRDVQKLPSALVGKPAPAVAGSTLEGGSFALDSLTGRVVILNFWASWCIPCRTEHGVLLQAERSYADREVRLVGVVYQDAPAAATRFMERMGGSWPSVLDPGSRIAVEYGVYGVPETFFLDRDGRIAHKQIGPVTREVLRSVTDSLLALPRQESASAREAASGRETASARETVSASTSADPGAGRAGRGGGR